MRALSAVAELFCNNVYMQKCMSKCSCHFCTVVVYDCRMQPRPIVCNHATMEGHAFEQRSSVCVRVVGPVQHVAVRWQLEYTAWVTQNPDHFSSATQLSVVFATRISVHPYVHSYKHSLVTPKRFKITKIMFCTIPQKPQNDVSSFLGPNFTILNLAVHPLTSALKRAPLVDCGNLTNTPRYFGKGARQDVSQYYSQSRSRIRAFD